MWSNTYIKYIGANDHDLDLFESQYAVPNGVSYNSWVILDEKAAVLDTVDSRKLEEWLANLEEILEGRAPDYLVIHHMEPDHAGGVRVLADKYPDMKLVGNAKTFAMTAQFFGSDYADRRVVVCEGDTLPLLVYLHGGGWTIGSINSCARYCAAMADNGVAVLAVDYRLAPEHPFPAGLNDCIDAVKTASDSLATWQCNSISLGGDSSGGNLAVAAALAGLPCRVAGLVLFYPVTEAYADNSESWIEYGEGYGLDAALMDAFNDAYTDDSRNPLVSPALASDSTLVSLPPLLLVAAERDILRSQGEKFAVRLEKLGVDVTHRLIPGSVHLFITVPGQPAAFDEAVRQSRVFLHAL